MIHLWKKIERYIYLAGDQTCFSNRQNQATVTSGRQTLCTKSRTKPTEDPCFPNWRKWIQTGQTELFLCNFKEIRTFLYISKKTLKSFSASGKAQTFVPKTLSKVVTKLQNLPTENQGFFSNLALCSSDSHALLFRTWILQRESIINHAQRLLCWRRLIPKLGNPSASPSRLWFARRSAGCMKIGRRRHPQEVSPSHQRST